jgi:HD-GYP domain-containing protein (c-di-GMP phosphodiesterase class II)
MSEPQGASKELALAQAQLGRSLEKANQGGDRALANLMREEGQAFLSLMVGCLRMTRVHALDNHAFDKPVAELEGLMRRLDALLGAVHVVVVEDQVYLNDVRVRLDSRNDNVAELQRQLAHHGAGGLRFHEALSDAEIRVFIRLLSGPAGDPPRAALANAIQAEGITQVQLLGTFRFRVSGEPGQAEHQVNAETAARRGRRAISEAWDNLERQRMPNPLPVRRAVGQMMEAGLDGDGLLLDGAENPHGAHAVRVAKLAMILSESLGLTRGSQQDLGVAGLFHDIGYANREGATKTEPGHAPPFTRHATAGARLLMKQRGFHESKIRRMLAVLEHHLDLQDPVAPPTLFGRILRVAEDYDNLALVYGPPRALRHMVGGANSLYDPVVVQALVNRLGRWPPGSLVELETGQIAVCTGLVRDPERFATPMASVVLNADGSDVTQPSPIDLSEHPIKGSARAPQG